MKTWKRLKAIAKRQGMPLDIRANMAAIDDNKGAIELFAVSCYDPSKKDRIKRLCVEIALKELRNPKLISAEVSSRAATRVTTKPLEASSRVHTRGATKP